MSARPVLGKLAEVLGLDPASSRDYLREMGIPLRTQDRDELTSDEKNA
jgi:hypothetical protein